MGNGGPGRARHQSSISSPGPHTEANENLFSAFAAWLSPGGGAGSSGELSLKGDADTDGADAQADSHAAAALSGIGATQEEKDGAKLEAIHVEAAAAIQSANVAVAESKEAGN